MQEVLPFVEISHGRSTLGLGESGAPVVACQSSATTSAPSKLAASSPSSPEASETSRTFPYEGASDGEAL